MEDSKDYFVANIVTKEEMQCKGYMDFLLHRMKERISNGILAIVSDGNEYAIKMLPEQRIERPDIMTVEVRNGISVQELVRCGECIYRSQTLRGSWCTNSKSCCHGCLVRKDFFCASGKRKEKEKCSD